MKFYAICIIFFITCVSGAFGANVRRKREENNPESSSKVEKSVEEIDSSKISTVDKSSFDELDALELTDSLNQLSSSEIKFLTEETSTSSKEENLSVVLPDDSVSSKDKDSSDDSFTEESTSSESEISGDDTSVESSSSSEKKNFNKGSSLEASTSSQTKDSDEDSSISASTSSETKNSNEDSSISASTLSKSKNSKEDSSVSASTSSKIKHSNEDSSVSASTSSKMKKSGEDSSVESSALSGTKNSGENSSEQTSSSSESKKSTEDSSEQASTSSETKDSSKDSSKHADKSSDVRVDSVEDSNGTRSHERHSKCKEHQVTTQKPKQTTTQIYLDPKVQGLNIALYFALQKMNRKILFGHEIQFESLVKVLALTYKIEKAGGSVIDLNKLMLRTVASFYPQSLKEAMISEDF